MKLNTKTKFIALAIAGVATFTLTGCFGDTSTPAPAVGQDVHSLNDLQDQNVNETIQAFNIALKNPNDQYPASQMSNSLELQTLKERDLYLNDTSKLMYIYIFPSGRPEVFFSSVRGKVSSMSSEMTATDGVYQGGSCEQGGCGNTVVPMPQDDLSYGGTEFGDNGIFWFDEQGGFHEAGTAGATVMIEAAPLKINAIELPAQPMDLKILEQMNKK
jgi:hypothetical protein